MAGALGVVITTDVPVEGRAAVPVYVDDSLPIVGPSQAIVVTSGEVPQMGGPALAVRLAPAGTPAIGPALPVYVVPGGGSLGVTVLAPVNSVLPVVSGTTELGQTLTTTNGTWTGSPSFTYQWKRGGVNIGGATNNTYVLVLADLGTTITATVTATNAAGNTSATSAGTVIPAYLLLDRFTTNASAPLTSPRTCEPGPGTLTITDTANRLSIASNKLTIGPSATAYQLLSGSFARAAGLAASIEIERPPGGTVAPDRWGVTDGSADNRRQAFYVANTAALSGLYASGSLILPAIDYTTIDRYILILRAAGCFFLLAVAGHYYLVWIDNATANATVQTSMVNANTNVATGSHTADTWQVTQLAGDWATANPYATNVIASPTNPQATASAADGTVEFTWTPVAAETLEIQFRKTDASNLFKLVCDQTANTIKLYRRQAGADTELDAGKTQTWTAGTPRRIVVTFHDTIIRSVVANVNKHNTTSSFNATATGVDVAGFATGSNLICWPWEVPALPSPFDSPVLSTDFMTYGDSKTAAGTYQTTLIANLLTATGKTWIEYRVARSGFTVGAMAPTIDADMAGVLGSPTVVLCNLGANDMSLGLPSEAAWKANYLTIFDAMHVKLPDALIYVMRPWIRDHDADANTLATWVSDLLALRSFLRLGPDERVFLKGSDNGVTYTSDGVHPNAAGYILTAQQWQTAIGL